MVALLPTRQELAANKTLDSAVRQLCSSICMCPCHGGVSCGSWVRPITRAGVTRSGVSLSADAAPWTPTYQHYLLIVHVGRRWTGNPLSAFMPPVQ